MVGSISKAGAHWESARFIEADGVTNHVIVTGKARGWQVQQGHPRLRLSCETSYGGGELRLGFHFPAGHPFPLDSSFNEPVSFSFNQPVDKVGLQRTLVHSKVEYLFRSAETVFHTTLASEGFVTSFGIGELLLDLLSGDSLDVHFMHTPQRYRVQYSLEGFAASAHSVLQACQLGDIDERDLRANWQDNGLVSRVNPVSFKVEPAHGAAEPVVNSLVP